MVIKVFSCCHINLSIYPPVKPWRPDGIGVPKPIGAGGAATDYISWLAQEVLVFLLEFHENQMLRIFSTS